MKGTDVVSRGQRKPISFKGSEVILQPLQYNFSTVNYRTPSPPKFIVLDEFYKYFLVFLVQSKMTLVPFTLPSVHDS